MFTGIVQDCVQVVRMDAESGLVHFTVKLGDTSVKGLKQGASVAVDGTCLTVTKIESDGVTFDAMGETLERTTLGELRQGRHVNIEKSVKVGDEIGGHLVSGHIDATVKIIDVKQPENNHIVTFQCSEACMKYIFPKGFIALDGISLTVVDVDREQSRFTVHFIPETLRITTFGFKKEGDLLNL